MFDIQEELKKLPDKSGVYIMKDEKGNIIYIGKAVVLKNRVRQYFHASSNHTPKVLAMVAKISEFEYIVTDTELEALILECNLIKKFRPKFNILLKDDKTYPYIKVTMNEDYPRIFMTRRIEKNGAKYFGPYSNVFSVKETLNLIRKIFPIKSCKRELPRDIGKGRPCLNYHIKQCLGPCTGNVDKEEYRAVMQDICSFLDGKQDIIITKLEKKMQDAAERLDFEEAAALRDKLASLRSITEEQKVLSIAGVDQDVVGFASNKTDTCVQVFFVRGGKLLGREHFIIEGSGEGELGELASSFLKQFYASASLIPPEIVVATDFDDIEVIEEWLSSKRGGRVRIKVPKRGEKLHMVEMVSQNAEIELTRFTEKITGDESVQAGLMEMTELLGLPNIPERIEAYDISNTGSTEIVASMVVFEHGVPAKKEYRHFKVRSTGGQDDYASMQETLYRRLCHGLAEKEQIEQSVRGVGIQQEQLSKPEAGGRSEQPEDIIMMQTEDGQVEQPADAQTLQFKDCQTELSQDNQDELQLGLIEQQKDNEIVRKAVKPVKTGFSKLPDIILLDGGAGHVNAVSKVLDQLNVSIPLFGMVKDDKHRTRGLVVQDDVIDITKNLTVLRLVTAIQDEAHRFALEYNKKLRTKRYARSVLDDIDGIGQKRKKALLKHFGSVSNIKQAGVDDLSAVEGISVPIAERIYEFFHN